MFIHPEDLHRLHQLEHAEMVRNHSLEREARAARRPTHRFREIGRHVGSLAQPRRWWKAITAMFTHCGRPGGTGTTLREGALPITPPPTSPLGSPVHARTDLAAETPTR